LPPVEIRKNKEKIFDYEMKYGGQSKEQRAKSKDEYKKETDNRSEKSDLVLGTRYLELSRSEEIVPATFPPSIKKELERLAMAAHEALGLAHYSRSDFIVSPHRGIFILETNSLPGLTNESLVPKELAAVGASLSNFVDHLITLALNE
jgi:D-alanine-D-alanine ligase-like ATP-grasp enzyme